MSASLTLLPFASEGAKARRLGFQMKLHHDPNERVVRIVMVPVTKAAKAAVRSASESQGAYGVIAIEAGTHYDPISTLDIRRDVKLADAVKATIDCALERARDVMA